VLFSPLYRRLLQYGCFQFCTNVRWCADHLCLVQVSATAVNCPLFHCLLLY
jgi:hypothetical protein